MTNPQLRPVVQLLIDAQRALTRALMNSDPADKRAALVKRDAAVRALEQAFFALEMAYDLVADALVRQQTESTNLAALVAAIREKNPALIDLASEWTSFTPAVDPRFTDGFLDRLHESIDLGLAERVDGHVRITYAGALELIAVQAKQRQLEKTKDQLFAVERELRAVKQSMASSGQAAAASSTSPLGAHKRAVGA